MASETKTVSAQMGICPLCNEQFEPSFSNGVHLNCPEIIRRAAPDLLAACKLTIGFCVNARQTWPDWQDHQDVGLLFAKVTALMEKAGVALKDVETA